MKRIILACLVTIATVASAAENKPRVSVTLDLAAQLLLPGVPFEISVTYNNLSEQRVAVGTIATVIVTPKDEQPIRMKRRAGVETYRQPSPNIELEPGQSLSGVIGWSAGWLYEDAEVSTPGTYEIALELTGNPNELDDEDGAIYVPSVKSAPVTLTRTHPVGEDAVVWARLREAAGGQWPSHGFGSRAAGNDAISDEVVAKYSRSGYYPYALLLGHARPSVDLQAVRDAVKNFHSSPAYPQLLRAACLEAIRMSQLASNVNRPVSEIESYLNLAKFYNDEALHSASTEVKAEARGTAGTVEFEFARLKKRQVHQ